MLCNDVHTAFSGRSLCTISNSALFCTTLLKTACCQQEQQPASSDTSATLQSSKPYLSPGSVSSRRSSGSTVRTHSRKSSSGGGGGGVEGVDGGEGRNILGRSKPIPIQRQTNSRLKRDRDSATSQNFFPNSTCGVGSTAATSYSSPQSWSIVGSNGGAGTPRSFRSWVIIPEPGDSDQSGYEADIERGTHNVEMAESCGEMEDSDLKDGELLRSLTSYLVPPEVQQRVWILDPIWYCIDLLRENVSMGLTLQGFVIICGYVSLINKILSLCVGRSVWRCISISYMHCLKLIITMWHCSLERYNVRVVCLALIDIHALHMHVSAPTYGYMHS